MGKEKNPFHDEYNNCIAQRMASSSQQPRINRYSAFNLPQRSQSMYIPRSGLDEPEILKRRARSTRGGKMRKSTLFSSRSTPKIPQIENSSDLFERVINALRDCAENVKDNIQSSPITAKRSLEQKLRWCEDRLSQVDGLYEFYKHEIRMRQGARNLETALLSYGVKHGHDKCKSNYRESTQNMCEIEDEFERRIGRFKVTIDALDGFARLCPGDNFEIFVRNGIGRKWKAKCKIEKDGQKWSDNYIEVKGSLKDGLFLRIIEIKKIQSNSQLGSFSVRLRNYIAARPVSLSIPVNKTGNLKLRVTIHWQPLSTKEESKLRKSNREGLLSEVFFGSVVNVNHDPRETISSPSFPPSSPSVTSTTSSTSTSPFVFDSVSYENHRNEDDSSMLIDKVKRGNLQRDLLRRNDEVISRNEKTSVVTSISEPSTLDQLLRKLLNVLTEHIDQHPQLQQLCEKLENIDEILQGGKLHRNKLSGSVESALESFSFLDLTDVGVKRDHELRPSDTGYSSCTDEIHKSDHFHTVADDDGETKMVKIGANVSERCLHLENHSTSWNSFPDQDYAVDDLSCSSDIGSTGIPIIDKVLLQHLKFCLRLTKDLGSIGPLKCKETSAAIKLEWQCGILEKLIELANSKQPPQTISKAYSPLAASGHDEILLFWAGNCGENPLYISCKDFMESFRTLFNSEMREGFDRILDKLYVVIATRVLEENGCSMSTKVEEDCVISVYQFTDFFLIDHRWNLGKFVRDVADELLACSRLLNEDKAVVLTQLQMYNRIPFQQSCCVITAKLLTDDDQRIVLAAGVYFENLMRNEEKRAQAVSYCIEALEDGEEDVRVGACLALKKLQGREAIEQLLFLAKCDTEKVKEAVSSVISFFESYSQPNDDDDKNAKIWRQATAMLDVSKSTDF